MNHSFLPLAGIIACLGFSTPANPRTVADIVATSGGDFDRNGNDFDILLTALQTAGLVGAVADPGADLTVFAPSDSAFVRLARDLGYDGRDEEGTWNFLVAALTGLGSGDPIPVLTDVLLYHVSPDVVGFRTLLFGPHIETLLEDAFIRPRRFRLGDNDPGLRDARVRRKFPIHADNGRIYPIDRVLAPVDLPDVVSRSKSDHPSKGRGRSNKPGKAKGPKRNRSNRSRRHR